MQRSRTCVIAPALALSLLIVTACGDDGDDEAAVASTTTTTVNDSVAVSAADYRFEDLPEELPSGRTITLHNTSTAELHELVLLRLEDDERRSVDELMALPEEQLDALFGAPPALVLVAPPGEDGFVALGDGTVDEPGRYIAVCFIPTGANPQAFLDALEANPGQPPSVDGGAPHFTSGMYQEVTVG
jgi:hypothetical protein